MSWKEDVKQQKEQGKYWSEIIKFLRENPESKEAFEGLGEREAVKKAQNSMRGFKTEEKKIITRDKIVGIVGDLHAPFDHENYFHFINDTFERFKVDEVVFIGDLADNHAISRHQTEPSAYGAYDELERTIGRLAQWTKRFPTARLCVGNHDLIPRRQAATIGMGKRYLKSIGELLQLPNTWEIEDKFIVNNVVYKHGTGYSGKYGFVDAAIDEQKSTVIGHLHSALGIKYVATADNLIFGMGVACGVDNSAYAMAYGRDARYKPVLGCGIVFNQMHGTVVPMSMDYFRS